MQPKLPCEWANKQSASAFLCFLDLEMNLNGAPEDLHRRDCVTSAAGKRGEHTIDSARNAVGHAGERNAAAEELATPNPIAESARGLEQPESPRTRKEPGTRQLEAEEQVTTPNAIAEFARESVQPGQPRRRN